jgi:hypothetical protein
MDISGWYLTDDQFNLTKHQFPAGTTIDPNGYFIVWADEDGSQGPEHVNFKLSAGGEQLMLLNSNMEMVDELSWGTLPADSSYARSPNATGNFVVKYHTWSINNDSPLSTSGLLDENQVLIYPNPAKSFVSIKIPSKAIQEFNEVEVLDITGKKIWKQQASSNMRISTENLADGLYLLKFGTVSKKFLVQH